VIAISLRPSGRKWGTVSFASTLHLCPVLDLLLMDVPPRWREDVRLGLQEALVNASKHGNNLDPNKTVIVRFSLMDGRYWWVISDQGSGFKPSVCSDELTCSEQEIHEVGECGRGLYILHQVFDTVHWNQEGNELTLCKQVPRLGSRLSLIF
jgi:serine/threonine-protein kinase RsbW